MKVILEFETDNETLDDSQLRLYLDGPAYHRVVTDMDDRLRSITKYGQDSDKVAFAQELRDALTEDMHDYGCSLR